jgi:hypothetical protein
MFLFYNVGSIDEEKSALYLSHKEKLQKNIVLFYRLGA